MAGQRVGYIRVSSFDQNPERQLGVTPPFVKNCTLSREPEVTTAPELL
jgi:hypothetical protein